MTVVGRVLDPAGQAGAERVGDGLRGDQAGGRRRRCANAPAPLGQAACDGSGRYPARHAPDLVGDASHDRCRGPRPGFGMGWVDLDVDADQPAADITLRPEQVIEGRLFDIKGRVVPGVRVAVEGMGHPQRGPDANLPEFIEGPHFWGGAYAKTPPAWPASGGQRRRGPLHHPRGRPRPARPAHGR